MAFSVPSLDTPPVPPFIHLTVLCSHSKGYLFLVIGSLPPPQFKALPTLFTRVSQVQSPSCPSFTCPRRRIFLSPSEAPECPFRFDNPTTASHARSRFKNLFRRLARSSAEVSTCPPLLSAYFPLFSPGRPLGAKEQHADLMVVYTCHSNG